MLESDQQENADSGRPAKNVTMVGVSEEIEYSYAIPHYELDDLKKVSRLGEGTFADVDLVISPSGDAFALKRLALNRIKSKSELSMAAADLAREVTTLIKLKHPNIICVHGLSGKSGSAAYFLMEVLQDTLRSRFKRWRSAPKKNSCISRIFKPDSEYEAMLGRIETIALGVARGMEYLHEQDIVLQDLKPANIGFNNDGHPVIFDFGMAYQLGEGAEPAKYSGGTPRYMAPEIWRGNQPTTKCDVFSFGIVLFEICTLKLPWAKKQTVKEIRDTILSGQRPSLRFIANKDLRDLVRECWDHIPKNRPNFVDVNFRLSQIVPMDDTGEKTFVSVSSSSAGSIEQYSVVPPSA